jgi:carbamoyltransferase
VLVIGFNWPNFHDNAVAAILDGKLVYASEEERYTRNKHSPYELPANALEHCFRFLKGNYGISPGNVDAYATNFDPRLYGVKSRAWHSFSQASLVKDYALRNDMASLAYSSTMRTITRSVTSRLDFAWSARLFIKEVLLHMGYSSNENEIRVIPVRHHLAHAASAYYFSGFDSAASIVVDGQGETDSTTAWSVKRGSFENVFGQSWNSLSMGYLYEYVSKYLGFSRLEGPGKVMGLAPYGRDNAKMMKRLKSAVAGSNGLYQVKKSLLQPLQDQMYDGIAEYVTDSKTPIMHEAGSRKLNQTACDYAHTMQSFFENLLLGVAERIKSETGQKNLVLSGGSALNAKANMELHYSKIFGNISVFPAANDSGGPIGAAAYAYSELGGVISHGRLSSVYLGDSYSEDEVKASVIKSKLKSEKVGDDISGVLSAIEKGMVVGFYNGRSELGPRALGNRSIVADPRNRGTWDKVNTIKGREWWRPLAPSLLENSMKKYFVDPVRHEFMVMMFHTTKSAEENAPAINHVDMTARPQTVSAKLNPLWYKLIKGFESDTGEGIVVNTSFNNAGEPLVETPTQALRSFASSGLDMLYLQGWLVTKR